MTDPIAPSAAKSPAIPTPLSILAACATAILALSACDASEFEDGGPADSSSTPASDAAATDAGTGQADTTTGGSGDATTATGDFGAWSFDWKKHSFSFDNYGNDPPVTNLTPVEVLRMFGDSVCAAPPQGDTCELTPSARNLMESTSKSMDGGHCEGMAALSLLFAVGKLNSQDFGAATAYELKLEGNEKLQREIAYWWATQGLERVESGTLRLPPDAFVAKLQESFKGGGEAYSIGLYKRNQPADGHAVTPFAVADLGDGKFGVQVYENNLPNDAKQFDISKSGNSWSYIASTNPAEKEALYDGDGDTNMLELTALTSRLGQHSCSVCGEVQADGKSVKGNVVKYRSVQLSGDGDLLLTDDNGNKLGFDGGAFVNKIPGAKVFNQTHELSFWDDRHDPVYRLPLGVPLKISLDGSKLTEESTSDVYLTAPGYTFAVQDVLLSPGQKDLIEFSAGCDSVRYVTSGSETPVLELGVTLAGADYLFSIAVAGEADGVDVELTIDIPNGTLAIRVAAPDGQAQFGIAVLRVGEQGAQVFKHIGNTIGKSAVVHLAYGAWSGDGKPMGIQVDDDGDGSMDKTEQVSDDGN